MIHPFDNTRRSGILRPVSDPQLHKLDQLINAATAARLDASRGDLFASKAGKALVNAAHDLFECDQLYDLREQIASELGEDREITRSDMAEHEADLRQGRCAR